MEHIISDYESDTLSFKDVIDLKPGREGTVAIRTSNMHDSEDGYRTDRTSVHLEKDQLLLLIADLAEMAAKL